MLSGVVLLLRPLKNIANAVNLIGDKNKRCGGNPAASEIGEHAKSTIYVCKNGTPEQNVAKLIEMMGGIEKVVGQNDIVIIKPNAQWKNHGMTNTNTIKGLIDVILKIHNFSGEVIIAENHHARFANSLAWTTKERGD